MDAAKRPSYSYKHGKIGKKITKTASALLKIRLYSEKSSSLEDDFNKKVLSHITFIGAADQTDQINYDGISGVEKKIIIKVDDKYGFGNSAKVLVENLKQYAKSRKMKLKGQFEDEAGGRARTLTREIDIDKAGFADQLFTQSETISVKKDLPAAYEEIDSEVVVELHKLLSDQSYWA